MIKIAVIPFLCLFSLLAIAQSPEFYTIHFDMSNGLSQMKVSTILEDDLGIIWIGTRNGLNRFNGEEFQVFRKEDGLSSNRILNMALAKDGTLMILTSGGLNSYDGTTFKKYPREFQEVDYKIFIDKDESTWIFGYGSVIVFNQGVYRELMIDGPFSLSYFDAEKSLLNIQKSTTLYKVNAELEIDTFNQEKKFTRADRITLPFSGHYGTYFYNDNYDTIVVFDQKSNLHKIALKNDVPVFFSNKLPLIYKEKLYWNNQNELLELSSTIIRPNKILLDKKGILWVGGENGIAAIKRSSFYHYENTTLPYIWSVIEDDNQNLYFGSYGNGIFKQDSGTYTPQKIPINGFNLFHSGATKGENDRLYFSNNGGILIIVNDKIVSKHRRVSFAIAYDSLRMRIISGTINGIDILENGKFISKIDQSSGIHENYYIQNISIDHHHRYWLGSYQGLSLFDPQNESIINYTESMGNLPAGPGVFSSYVDQDGYIWLGGERGLMYVKPYDDSIIRVPAEQFNVQIKAIESADSKHLIIASKDELYLFNKETFLKEGLINIMVLNKNNGYQGIEPAFNGIYKRHNGELVICSASSVDILNIKKLDIQYTSTKPYIISLNNKTLPFLKRDSVFNLGNTNSLFIEAESIGLERPMNLKYNYKLNDQPWSGWRMDKSFNISDLSHGTHTIQVATGLSSNLSSPGSYDAVNFRIDLPLYKRAFFLPVVIVFFIFLILFTIYQYIKRVLANKRLNNQLIESRYLKSQLLLSQLNPHFIFNVLASIQNKILSGKTEEASSHVVKLADVIRDFLKASYQSNSPAEGYKGDHSLAKEVFLLTQFVEFEKEKSDDHFEFEVHIAKDLDQNSIFLPPLIIQPFVENSIKHGLLHTQYIGKLDLYFNLIEGMLQCKIIDNGIGRKASEKIYKKSIRTNKSLGILIIRERINILNQLGHNIEMKIDDHKPSGTCVTLLIQQEELNDIN